MLGHAHALNGEFETAIPLLEPPSKGPGDPSAWHRVGETLASRDPKRALDVARPRLALRGQADFVFWKRSCWESKRPRFSTSTPKWPTPQRTRAMMLRLPDHLLSKVSTLLPAKFTGNGLDAHPLPSAALAPKPEAAKPIRGGIRPSAEAVRAAEVELIEVMRLHPTAGVSAWAKTIGCGSTTITQRLQRLHDRGELTEGPRGVWKVVEKKGPTAPHPTTPAIEPGP